MNQNQSAFSWNEQFKVGSIRANVPRKPVPLPFGYDVKDMRIVTPYPRVEMGSARSTIDPDKCLVSKCLGIKSIGERFDRIKEE